jgi:photosystem II stability/assembly factor-like uncharacterized protein
MSWFCAASNFDSSVLLAGQQKLYISTDLGNIWSEIGLSVNAQYWTNTILSSNGSVILATAHPNGGGSGGDSRLYISTDSGSTWAETGPVIGSNRNWSCIAMSSDGSILFAGSIGRLYISTDSGSTWAETGPAIGSDRNWFTVSSSSDGSVILAGINSGELYFSTDSGSTWNDTGLNRTWYCSTINSVGSVLTAGSIGNGLYVSTDSGNTWSNTTSIGTECLRSAANASGSVLIVATGTPLHISTNFGSSWNDISPPSGGYQWDCLATSATGSLIMAGGDRLWLSANFGNTWSEMTPVPTTTPGPTTTPEPTTPGPTTTPEPTTPGPTTTPEPTTTPAPVIRKILFTQKSKHVIKKLNSSYIYESSFGTFGVRKINNTGLNFPIGFDIDTDKNVYICDSNNQRIVKLDETLTFVSSLNVSSTIGKPFSIIVDTNDLYVAGVFREMTISIAKIPTSLSGVSKNNTNIHTAYDNPFGICRSFNDSDFLIALNNQLLSVTEEISDFSEATQITIVGEETTFFTGIMKHSSGNLFLVANDSNFGKIVQVDSTFTSIGRSNKISKSIKGITEGYNGSL